MLLRRGGKIRHEIDMTEGPILPKIAAFTGPLILTGILQLLYNAADVIVVGNYAGHEALAAVFHRFADQLAGEWVYGAECRSERGHRPLLRRA